MAAISTNTLCLRAARSLASSAQFGLGLTGADANPRRMHAKTHANPSQPDHLTSHATPATTVNIDQSGPAHLRSFLRSTRQTNGMGCSLCAAAHHSKHILYFNKCKLARR